MKVLKGPSRDRTWLYRTEVQCRTCGALIQAEPGDEDKGVLDWMKPPSRQAYVCCPLCADWTCVDPPRPIETQPGIGGTGR